MTINNTPQIRAGSANGWVDVAIPNEQLFPYFRRGDMWSPIPPAIPVTMLGQFYLSNLPNPGPPNAVQAAFTTLPLTIQPPLAGPLREESEFSYASYPYLSGFPSAGPWQWPFELAVDVFDELCLDSSPRRLPPLHQIEQFITRDNHFVDDLIVQFRVRVAVPRGYAGSQPPELQLVSLTWPMRTCYHALSLTCAGQPLRLRYNVTNHAVEWRNSPMQRVAARDLKDTETNLLVYQTNDLRLHIGDHSEFFGQAAPVRCRLEIALPGCLLSGTQVDFFDARGVAWGTLANQRINRRTTLRVDMEIDLQACFQQRTFSKLLEFFFEGMVLKHEEVEAMENVLRDLGFALHDAPLFLENGRTTVYGAFFERRQSQTQMVLWVCARGSIRASRRESELGSRTYITPVETGDTAITLRAQMAGDGRELLNTLNAVHRAFEQHFRYMTPPD